jgi:hypothetical protein
MTTVSFPRLRHWLLRQDSSETSSCEGQVVVVVGGVVVVVVLALVLVLVVLEAETFHFKFVWREAFGKYSAKLVPLKMTARLLF